MPVIWNQREIYDFNWASAKNPEMHLSKRHSSKHLGISLMRNVMKDNIFQWLRRDQIDVFFFLKC